MLEVVYMCYAAEMLSLKLGPMELNILTPCLKKQPGVIMYTNHDCSTSDLYIFIVHHKIDAFDRKYRATLGGQVQCRNAHACPLMSYRIPNF